MSRDARQGDEGVAAPASEPRIACDDVGTAGIADDELPGRVTEAGEEIVLARPPCRFGFEHLVEHRRRGDLFERAGEYDGLSLRDFRLEIARGEQVLEVVVAALALFGVFEIVVPVGRRDELRPGVGLQVEPRKAFVEPVADASGDGEGAAVGIKVGLAQGVFVAEGEERPQAQYGLRAGFEQRVADEQLCVGMYPENLLTQQNAPYTVGQRRQRRIGEIDEIFVPFRLVGLRKTVQGEVEGVVVLYDGFVQRREHHVVVLVALPHRAYEEAVVFPRVAAHDGGAHIAAGTVGREHLAAQGVFEVSQLILVEFED